jgi:hypothetical protein
LDFLLAILAVKAPHRYLTGFVFPTFQQVGNVKIHGGNMALVNPQVNGA